VTWSVCDSVIVGILALVDMSYLVKQTSLNVWVLVDASTRGVIEEKQIAIEKRSFMAASSPEIGLSTDD
jgi:hypothetical protein